MHKRALLALPFIIAAHTYFWPRGQIVLGLVSDVIGVTLIFNPFRRRT